MENLQPSLELVTGLARGNLAGSHLIVIFLLVISFRLYGQVGKLGIGRVSLQYSEISEGVGVKRGYGWADGEQTDERMRVENADDRTRMRELLRDKGCLILK